jgi:hypothetical protein
LLRTYPVPGVLCASPGEPFCGVQEFAAAGSYAHGLLKSFLACPDESILCVSRKVSGSCVLRFIPSASTSPGAVLVLMRRASHHRIHIATCTIFRRVLLHPMHSTWPCAQLLPVAVHCRRPAVVRLIAVAAAQYPVRGVDQLFYAPQPLCHVYEYISLHVCTKRSTKARVLEDEPLLGLLHINEPHNVKVVVSSSSNASWPRGARSPRQQIFRGAGLLPPTAWTLQCIPAFYSARSC